MLEIKPIFHALCRSKVGAILLLIQIAITTAIVSNAAFNNLGHPFYSTWVNWGRHTLGTVPFVMLFAWWLGAAGVLI